jgi:transposase-like protein
MDLYGQKGMSIAELSRRFDVGTASVHARLTAKDIPIRPRGGRNNKVVNVDNALLERCKAEGVASVATDLGLEYNTLFKAFKRAEGAAAILESPALVEQPSTPDSPDE